MLGIFEHVSQNGFMSEFWGQFIFPLLASQATTSFIAVITAVAAFIIYFLRRRHYKVDAC